MIELFLEEKDKRKKSPGKRFSLETSRRFENRQRFHSRITARRLRLGKTTIKGKTKETHSATPAA